MDSNYKPTVIWQQGDILPPNSIHGLQLPENQTTYWILVSHDCDINNKDFEKEPYVEVIEGEVIAEISGEDSNAKHSRRLDLEFPTTGTTIKLKLRAAQKRSIDRRSLLAITPPAVKLDKSRLFVLRKWLAARYKRAAFPDEFNRRLNHKFSKKDLLSKRIQNHLTGAEEVRAVLFDLDEGKSIERDDTTLYSLTIVLLYKGNSKSAEACEKICDNIESDFLAAFKQGDSWQLIELKSCYAVSEDDMRVAELERFDEFNLDYLSMDTEEKQETLLD